MEVNIHQYFKKTEDDTPSTFKVAPESFGMLLTGMFDKAYKENDLNIKTHYQTTEQILKLLRFSDHVGEVGFALTFNNTQLKHFADIPYGKNHVKDFLAWWLSVDFMIVRKLVFSDDITQFAFSMEYSEEVAILMSKIYDFLSNEAIPFVMFNTTHGAEQNEKVLPG